jgi:DNA-binding response OmpR family regulator
MDKKRVLVIDDSRFTSTLVREQLEERGYEVSVSSSGREGLELVRQERFDAVILDLILPDVSGESVCKDIKRHDGGIPVIMVTAKGTDADKVIGRVIGADSYIPKPFDVAELVRELTRLTAD